MNCRATDEYIQLLEDAGKLSHQWNVFNRINYNQLELMIVTVCVYC